MLKKYLIISTSTDLVRIAPDKIVFISSDGNYCNLVQTDNETRMLSFQLGQVENMIKHQLGTEGNLFIRIGRGLIINRNYIYYINIRATDAEGQRHEFGDPHPKSGNKWRNINYLVMREKQ